MGCQEYGMVHQGLGDLNMANETNFLRLFIDLRSSLMVLCQTTWSFLFSKRNIWSYYLKV
jgi:hypothetical protein